MLWWLEEIIKEVFMTEEKSKKLWSDVVARYYGDSEFASKFDSDPAGTLSGMGMEIPEGVNLHVHKNTDTDIHITLPGDPTKELGEDALGLIVGAGGCNPKPSCTG